MKALLTLMLAMGGSAMAADVAVSLEIGDPRFYGRIEIGDLPRPRILYPTPVVIRPIPVGVVRSPMYLRVPPGHEKHWEKHCDEYNACGHPVFFVEDGWYSDVYAPAYRQKHGHGDRPGKGHEKGNGKGKGKGHD